MHFETGGDQYLPPFRSGRAPGFRFRPRSAMPVTLARVSAVYSVRATFRATYSNAQRFVGRRSTPCAYPAIGKNQPMLIPATMRSLALTLEQHILVGLANGQIVCGTSDVVVFSSPRAITTLAIVQKIH